MHPVEQAVQQWRQAPFARGTTDCCAFCNYVLKELTGKDVLPEYGNDPEAFAILKKFGGLPGAVSHYMNQDMVDASEVKTGDVVLVNVMDHESIGILLPGDRVAVVFERGGLREVRADFVDGGWHVWA